MASAGSSDWVYANPWRLLSGFLGAAMVLLGIGLLGVTQVGADAAFGAGILLAIAAFLLVFAVLLFLPRLRRHGTLSFRIVVPRSVEEVEAAVREALRKAGRQVRVEVMVSRSARPPRVVIAEGSSSRFLLETLSRRESVDGMERTEVVQVGIVGSADEAARELRDLVGAALSPFVSGSV